MFKTPSRVVILGIMTVNLILIVSCVYLGRTNEDVSFLFQERETITFFSGLELGLISLLSAVIYVIKRILNKGNIQGLKAIRIWVLSALGFAFATCDEFLMIHEGIDGDIATFFWGIKENPHLDGITLGFYGVVAIFLFFKAKQEFLKYKEAIVLFCLGGGFFLLSISLDLGSVEQFRIILEESSKFIAVGFIFSGFVSIFSDVLKELESRIK